MKCYIALLFGMSLALPAWAAPAPLKPQAAKASSTYEKYGAAKAVDGEISDASRWISKKSDQPAWLEISLGATQKLAGVHLYSGYKGETPLDSFTLQFWRDGQWQAAVEATEAVENGADVVASMGDGVLYLQMEWLDGQPMSAWLGAWWRALVPTSGAGGTSAAELGAFAPRRRPQHRRPDCKPRSR